jgi:hypothetical protein
MIRLLGHLAPITHDRIEVLYLIRQCLNFDQPIELKAAVFAIDKLCARSATFAVNVCDELYKVTHRMCSNLKNSGEFRLALVDAIHPYTYRYHHRCRRAPLSLVHRLVPCI